MAKSKNKQEGHPALARVGDPLVTPSGRLVQPARKKKDIKKDQVQLDAKDFKTTRKRSLNELPATPAVVTGCAVVFMYSMLGLSDREIAQAAKIKIEDVLAVREHSAYAECFDIVSKEFVNANSELLTARIASYASDSVDKIADISMNGKEENSLRASIDIVDRATGTKSGVYGAGGGPGNAQELRIVIVDGDRKASHVEIDNSHFGRHFNGDGNGQEVIDQE